MSEAPVIDPWGFKRGSLIYPQPVAFACGRLLRITQPQDRIDACLKAAEVLCRYLAALSISSLRSREKEIFPETIKPLNGHLAFGHFINIVQVIAKVNQHPLQSYLAPFRPKGKGRNRHPGKADAPLVALLNLRNELGHELVTMQKARAITLLKKYNPEQLLLDVLNALEGILSLPLFVLENLSIEKKQIVVQRLLLMGDSPDPIPDRIQLSEALETGMPYVAMGDKVLALPPVVLFALIEEQSAYRLAFLDVVDQDDLRFKTQDANDFVPKDDSHDELMNIFTGTLQPLEVVRLADGATIPQLWIKERESREILGKQAEGKVPWEVYSKDTLDWYARKLPGNESSSPHERITTALLDGRSSGLPESELQQLSLLFGMENDIKRLLGRDMSDFRAVTEPGARWDERRSASQNILDTLVAGIEFFVKHVGLDAAEASDLASTTGSADYIAMREALVNQFIHQDFSDKSAAAQIELSPKYAVFFNTGYSLVTEEHLSDGGKSQARNPLIARALRLIGYAELAGSGIRALQYEWRKAKRRPPVIDSDRVGNTFGLKLDWREVPNAYDEVWKKKLGVQLTEIQAAILNLATDSTGISEYEAAAGTGLNLAEAKDVLRFLVHQVLLEEHDGRFHLKHHLKTALQ